MSLLAALHRKLGNMPSHRLEPVTVAVVDSGVDATHPDLTGRVIRAAHVKEAGKDYRIVEGAVPKNADVYGHGTAVSSIIVGLAPNAKIIDIRVLDENNVGTGEALLAGFQHAVEQKARIINMSLACRAKFAAGLHALCETAYRQNQIVVAAKRNMPLEDNGFPAELSSCIGVDIGKFRSLFDLRFRADHVIQFIAHGEEVEVAAAGGGHTTMTGTSFATPAVSGICALLVGAYPDLQPYEVKSLLRAFAREAAAAAVRK
jgi:subtilisin family serine protease